MSHHKSVPFEIFLCKYYKDNNNYTQDLKHLKIFYILQEKQVKSRKYISKIKESILVGYENINIFQIYFSLEKKIEQIQNVTFVKKHKNNIFPYISIDKVLSKENLNSVILNGTILLKMLANFTNSNHYILLLPTHPLLLAISSLSFTLSKLPDKI